MSIKVMSRVWEHSKQSGGAKLVLLALADFANDEGSCYPSIPTIARKANMCERNVQYIIRKLIKDGELRIEKEGGWDKQGRAWAHEYRVLVKGANFAPLGDIQCTNHGAEDCTPTVITNQGPQAPEGAVSEGLARIGSWFKRKPTDRPSPKEILAYTRIGETSPDDWDAMEAYYTAKFSPRERDRRRKSVDTLLTNWPGEMDRARAWRLAHPPPKATTPEEAERRRVLTERRMKLERIVEQFTTWEHHPGIIGLLRIDVINLSQDEWKELVRMAERTGKESFYAWLASIAPTEEGAT